MPNSINPLSDTNRFNPFNVLFQWGRSLVNRFTHARVRDKYNTQTVSPELQASSNDNLLGLDSDSRVVVGSSSYGSFIQKGLIEVIENNEQLQICNDLYSSENGTERYVSCFEGANDAFIANQLVSSSKNQIFALQEKKLFEIQQEGVSAPLYKCYKREKQKKKDENDLSGFYGILKVDNGQYFIQGKNKMGEAVITPIPKEGVHQYSFVTIPIIPIQDAQGNIIDVEIRVRKMQSVTDSRHLWMTNYELSVLYVGEMLFENGKIKKWDNQSGAYCPESNYARQAGLPMNLFLKHTPHISSVNQMNPEDNSASQLKSHRGISQDLTLNVTQTSSLSCRVF